MLRQSSVSFYSILFVSFIAIDFFSEAFVPATSFYRSSHLTSFRDVEQSRRCSARRVVSRLTNSEETILSDLNEEGEEDDEDIAFLFEDVPPTYEVLDVDEKVWRYAKKPLLRIGSKGATHAHGNSLRQLLEDHTVVKIKVNTKKFNNSVQEAYEALRSLAVENGAPEDLELIQLREHSKEILLAMPGTLQWMEEGTFPPPLPPSTDDESSSSSTVTA